MSHFLKGLAIGFTIAVPVGPVGVLCLKRSLREGQLIGLISGLGAAVADAIYGLVAAFGLTFITDELIAHRRALQLGGGAFLLFLGIKMLFAKPPSIEERGIHVTRLSRAFLSTFALTLTNPMTILSFVGIFAGFGVAANGSGGFAPASWLVAGVFSGSAIWWLMLSFGASWLGQRLHPGRMHFFHVLAGVTIAGFGVWQLTQFALGR